MHPLDIESHVERLRIGYRKGYVTEEELRYWEEELKLHEKVRRWKL